MSIGKLTTATEGQRQTAPATPDLPPAGSDPFRNFMVATIVLVLCFSLPLYDLLRFAVTDNLYSYIVLIPFISFYLAWLKRPDLSRHSEPARKLAALFLAIGLAVISGYWLAIYSHARLATVDYLAWVTLAFLLFFTSGGFLFLGRKNMRVMAFPVCFLIFMIPLPAMLRHAIESSLQSGSAAVAEWFFMLSNTLYFREGMFFQLTGITLEVAPECSGIHSSMALFITSLLAGHLFLRRPWKRIVLALVVIPLAILRNGFRIFVIGELCVHIGPEMINSPIHRHGGPLFFILSLIPFFLLLIYLRKSERTNSTLPLKTSGT
jgi:exosortase C (VPDSG-CTERM-specific)